jgi:indole-3-glycerol phosphate synthase
MNTDVAHPAVRSILDRAVERPGGTERLSVEARSFTDAIAAADADGRVPLIAEIKPTSPTAEGTRTGDPAALARAMVEGGASAISVLTEPSHFDGSPEALTAVREAVDVPVLRKDFLLRQEQLDVVVADLVLVIARFVEDLAGMVEAATERGMTPLVEVHDEAELEAALAAEADVIGINNRDLAHLEVDLSTVEELAPSVPADVTLIAESGIGDAADVRRMRAAGADALLVGSAIMDHAGTSDAASDAESFSETVRRNTERLTRVDVKGGERMSGSTEER